jgi:hypothetical protein
MFNSFHTLFWTTPGFAVQDAIALIGWDSLGTRFDLEAPRAPRPETPVEVVEWDPAEVASR